MTNIGFLWLCIGRLLSGAGPAAHLGSGVVGDDVHVSRQLLQRRLVCVVRQALCAMYRLVMRDTHTCTVGVAAYAA